MSQAESEIERLIFEGWGKNLSGIELIDYVFSQTNYSYEKIESVLEQLIDRMTE
jgi:hypothetical protein